MTTPAMKTLTRADLPQLLRDHFPDLIEALATPLLGKWDPEGPAYREAPQPEAIGRFVVEAIHEHLVNARIGYVFRERMDRNGKIRLATASKVGAKLQYFSELDFLIEVNWTAWAELTPLQRIALIDHEICHCGTEETESGETRFILIPHDVEEFGSIVARWGLWQPDLERFGNVIQRQLNLFDHPDPAGLKDLADREADDAEHEDDDGPAGPRRGRPKGSK